MKLVSRSRTITRAAAVALAATGLAAATGVTAAHAATGTNSVYYDSQAHWITASYTGMNVAVADSATYAGARVIQWYNDGGSEQKWYFDQVYDTSGGYMGIMIRNEHSDLCLFADATPGDTMLQEPCESDNAAELFWHYGVTGGDNWFKVRNTGCYMDVSGASYAAGANVDAWYSNNGMNQDFWVSKVGS